jgi:acyl-coenzyme A synthetase/AMP-(fatty) acid ligase
MTHVLSPANLAAGLIDSLIQANCGDRQAFAYRGRRYSFHDVAALMNRAANLLDAWQVPAGARVLVLLPPSPAQVASVLGAMKSARVPLVASPALDRIALAALLDGAGPAAAIVHEDALVAFDAASRDKPDMHIAVVGGDATGHVSFVQALREQSSWRAADAVGAEATVLEWCTDGKCVGLSRGALDAALAEGPAPDDAQGIVPMLRAFSRGEEVTLA